MQEQGSKSGNTAFGEHADSGLIVAYQSHQDALRFLSAAHEQANGVALLQGSTGSGKSTIVKEHREWASRDVAAALVDGAHLTPRQLLTAMLSQFCVQAVSDEDDQLLQALNRFVSQQARSGVAPVLIIDNVDRAAGSTLRLLNWLAALDVQDRYALRIVLTGKERLSALVRNDSMRNLARRNPATYTLNPLTEQETMIYLRTRLIAAGGEHSEKIFPVEVCSRLHVLSRGRPGRLNKLALELMQRMTKLRAKSSPRVIVTCDGETIAEHALTKKQYVIGRTELADIMIEDSYISKMHAMLQLYANALVLLDLNSTNGTTVNSIETQRTVLRSNDIITLGRHRIKIENAPALSAEMIERIRASDTITLRHLEDLRRSRARHTIAALKHK
jgi:type II secretory pathway predicted ATPase ExeA